MNEDMRWENICPDCKRHRRNCGCDKSIGDELNVDVRWKEIQRISARIAFQDGAPNEVESALCGAVVRAVDVERELAEARKDALRYRWLRRFDHFSQVNSMLDLIEYSTLDSAVDAAMDMERQITVTNK